MAKIIEIDEFIKFEDGTVISYYHVRDCCECNYADFLQLDDVAKNTDFDTSNLIFEKCDCGFRFGNAGKMFFVPCYSEQNGYYSSDVDIYLNDFKVLNVDGEWCDA
jgi:hypothetical protein